ncbi:TerB family tellurite resistance protein [Rhizobacter sp. AJA081-3]|uniref:YcjF family protein n=1 Tax=Rhizobacter sp. AJA081-3 TaxID=2753607 RepID=UPI001AE0B08D|nr:TerB family tellurite resistance protein [Rhizobacter sp. AJA081-3]QTN23764.1 TerB family tellurite resistance protein [Rhizobacter sp. AJA081-3]
MTPAETQAIATLAVLAAFADGNKHDRERDELKRIAEGLGQADAVRLPTLYQDVLMKRVDIASAVAALGSPEARQLAYEMAVCVCDADGAQSEAEARFLASLLSQLGLGTSARDFNAQAEEIAAAPIDEQNVLPAKAAAVDDAALDQAILNAAILNGALELLPETLSTMAIIPLQMKLVYGIGQAHGYQLDSGHVKDFIATVGVGLTSQYLEQAGRKLLGGLLGKVGGGLLGGLGRQAVSSSMSFATTYALGHVAKRYYAGGRTLSTQMLREAYSGVVAEAQGLQARYLPAMQQKARGLDVSKVLALARGR